MSKHTPGPWKATFFEHGAFQIENANTGEIIAECERCDDRREEQYANAHVVAAAPDLLEALVKIEEETWAPIHDKERFLRMRNIARAAIAKAEGRDA